jgi:threonylcarbamoyladenosine tRNA methylthiotransferase MtaB
MKKICITTLGCKVNQFESAAFKTAFEKSGMEIISTQEAADVVVINTCAVTGSAGSQSRQLIRQGLRKNPDAKVIITGCYAEIGADELAAEEMLQDREFTIIGNSKKDELVRISLEKDSPKRLLGDIKTANTICKLPVERFSARSRAYLRIQDGCESYCSYCIVPYTRGPSRSLSVDEVLGQAKVFADAGHKEIVLTGIHLGYYGRDLSPELDIVTLLDKLTRATPNIFYRISSLEPIEITDTLLDLMASRETIQPHLHIPLQSGDDEILKKMNRRYTSGEFKEVIERCHSRLPGLAIGIDILAGFPGETDEHFDRAKKFLSTINFSYFHVFPYSIRPGTAAADFDGQVSHQKKEARVAELREISDTKRVQFYRKHLGETRTVLVEGKRDAKGRLKGFTDNYIDTRFEGPDFLLGERAKIELCTFSDNYVIGKTVETYES